MSQSVHWTRPAVDDLRRLDQATVQRIRQAVIRLAEAGQGDVRRLRSRDQVWRLRVGQWRVLFTYDPPGTIVVLRVLPRDRAYRG